MQAVQPQLPSSWGASLGRSLPPFGSCVHLLILIQYTSLGCCNQGSKTHPSHQLPGKNTTKKKPARHKPRFPMVVKKPGSGCLAGGSRSEDLVPQAVSHHRQSGTKRRRRNALAVLTACRQLFGVDYFGSKLLSCTQLHTSAHH